MAKKEQKSVVTPVGTFMYPHLSQPNEPDPNNSFSPKQAQYDVKIAFEQNSPEWKKFEKQMTPIVEWGKQQIQEEIDAMPAGKRKKYDMKSFKWFNVEEDPETGEPTGRVTMFFKTYAKMELKRGPRAGQVIDRKPIIVDSDGNPCVPTPDIWGGTTGRVKGNVGTYVVEKAGVGLTFYLQGVQIHELVGPGTQDSGFEALEGGYKHEAPDAETEDWETDTDGSEEEFEGAF